MFYAKSGLGISWQHLNHPNFLVYRFYKYFHVRIILHRIYLPHEDNLSKVKNSYIKSA